MYVLALSVFYFGDRCKRQEDAGFLCIIAYGVDRSEWMIIVVLSLYVCMYVRDTVENDNHIFITGL